MIDLWAFIIISRSLLSRVRNVLDKGCRENHNTRFIFNNFFPAVYEKMWKNTVQPDRPQMTI